MRARLFIGASAAYAAIEAPGGRSMDVRLSPGMGAPESLRRTAAEWREEAARRIERAQLAEQAAAQLEADKVQP